MTDMDSMSGKEILLMEIVRQAALNAKVEEADSKPVDDLIYVICTHNDGTLSAVSNNKNNFIGYEKSKVNKTYWTGLQTDRNKIILSDQDGKIQSQWLRDLGNNGNKDNFRFEPEVEYQAHKGAILQIQFCKSTNLLFSLGKDKKIKNTELCQSAGILYNSYARIS